ncbi:phage capsid protein [Mediterraneibacter butyricigenes]|uniref:Phage capsid protein n=1 Tax=Mediterraneibacter butyricigenes TaxID=2316025 RepID=A0A391PAL7_9FIRM|nr:capsid protein [Mediterraneibacter butyricigenes]GCA68048.1 phage capsid protein [Mediterraneibacter butyricigenes]
MATLNYATQYQQALEQEFPYVLYFGALFSTPNNGRYRWVNSRVIEIPTISTTGRVDGDRETIGTKKRNFNNSWTPLTLENHRSWQTLVHPRDIDETNQVASIANITRVFNDEQKFPEMNAYCISKIYSEWTGKSKTADKTVLTTENVLEVFDKMMTDMDNNRVPRAGRILYVTPEVRTLINNAKQIYRTLDVSTQSQTIRRAVTSIDEVEIPESVPSDMMKTVYDFTTGWEVDTTAKQINMCLIHPTAVITPISYEFAKLDPPSAGSEGKWDYFEESFEDVFVLPNKVNAIAFNVEA